MGNYDVFTPDFSALSVLELENEIVTCACGEGGVPRYDNSPWDAFYRGYSTASPATRQRVDDAFRSLIEKTTDDTHPELVVACVHHCSNPPLSDAEELMSTLWRKTEGMRKKWSEEIVIGFTITAYLLAALSSCVKQIGSKETTAIKELILKEAPNAGLLPSTVSTLFTYSYLDFPALEQLVKTAKPAKNLKAAIQYAGYRMAFYQVLRDDHLCETKHWPGLLQKAYSAGVREGRMRSKGFNS